MEARGRRRSVVGLWLALSCGAEAAAETHRIPRIDQAATIDGRMDEDVWKSALKMEIDVEVEPGGNIAPPVETDLYVYHSRTHFYALFVAFDPRPGEIRARLSDRDDMNGDDWVGLILDTFDDQRRSYNFISNPIGVQLDMIETPDSGSDAAWDTIWASHGRITESGYVVEMAIPFSSLSFQKGDGEQTWGFDAVRLYPRNVRHRIGMFARDRSNNCYLCQAEKLVGFAGASPGRNVELDPTAAGVYTERRDDVFTGPFGKADSDLDLGLTARWGMTPNLLLAGAINPDFSQVEADAVQLEVNRQFALFYPEKRPFFMDGADFFRTPIEAVYTRTVADPEWGVKLTGKVGRGALGVFTLRDEITNLLFPGAEGSRGGFLDRSNQATAVRYRHDVGASSTIGLLATAREAGDYSNGVAGFDLTLRPTPTTMVRLQALGSRTEQPREFEDLFGERGGTFDGHGIDFMTQWTTQTHEAYVMYRGSDDGFRADLGFVPKVGTHYVDTGYLYNWRHDEPGHWYNRIRVWVGYEYEDDRHGSVLRDVAGTFVLYQGPMQSNVYSVLYTGRRGFRGVEYDNDTFYLTASFQPTAALRLGFDADLGDDIDYVNRRQADRVRIAPNLNLRLGLHLTLDLSHNWERLDVAAGHLYSANVSQLRVVYQLSPRTFFRATLQNVDYRFETGNYTVPVHDRFRHLLTQLLFSYKVNPQTALYLGYSDEYSGNPEAHDGLTQTDRTVFAKVGYALVF